MNETRFCTKCKQYRPITEFYPAKGKNGVQTYRAWCKSCNLAYNKARPKNDVRRWQNKATETAKFRFTALKTSARNRGIPVDLTFEEYQRIVLDGQCFYCGFKVVTSGGLDRVDSSQSYRPGNVVVCCSVCNVVKADVLSFEQMKEIGSFITRWREAGTLILPPRLTRGKFLKSD